MNHSSRRSGILLVDKPGGLTSHDVVSRTRKLAGTRRVGHAGTLDPMATGLLVLGLNSTTRLLTYLVGLDKEYLATIRLGGSTPTNDADSAIDVVGDPAAIAALTEAVVREAIVPLTGELSQVPSAVSAIKVDGRRSYERVRAGERVELKSRAVTVTAFDVLEVRTSEFCDVDVRISCSTGTYVRALARDLGESLGVGGHVTALRRTKVGPFSVSQAHTIDSVDVTRDLVAPAEIAREIFSEWALTDQETIDLGHGKRLDAASASLGNETGPIAAIAPDGRLVGLVTVVSDTAVPLINFPPDGE